MKGKNRRKRRKRKRKKQQVPPRIVQSIQLGVYECQLEGRKSSWSEPTMSMKRSDHIPT
jgi:hypothetical protein